MSRRLSDLIREILVVGPENLYPLKTLCFETVRSRCSSFIVVMEAADLHHLVDTAQLRPLHRPSHRGIHVQGPMRPPVMIVRHVGLQHAREMLFVQHDHVVETLATDAPDDPLTVGVLPGTVRGDRDLFDAHGLDSLLKSAP